MADAIALGRVVDLSDAEREALRGLSVAVSSPGESASWPGRQLEWSAHEWCVRVHGDHGALVSYVGIVLRDALYDGRAHAQHGMTCGIRTAAPRAGTIDLLGPPW